MNFFPRTRGAQPRVSQRAPSSEFANVYHASGSDKYFSRLTPQHHAAKMRYIHSEEDLKVPEGGAFPPKFHPIRP